MNQVKQLDGMKSLDFSIEGMTCASCVSRVEKAIRAVPGVASASVNLATERARIELSGPTDIRQIAEAVRKAGYTPAAAETITLDIEGMTCASCVGRVEKALKRVEGVVDAAVNLATERPQSRCLAEQPGKRIWQAPLRRLVTASEMSRPRQKPAALVASR